MANIRIKDLPADGAPKQTDLIPIDLGSTRHATVKAVVESGRPNASKAEAEAGVDASKAMTPLTTKQAIDAQVGASYVPKTFKVTGGDGLTGGGALTGDVTVGLTATNVDRLTKVDGIEAGAQVNTVTSVAGKTGAVTLVAADVSSAPDTLVPDINANTLARHTHSNKAILDATTASFLAAEKTKLSGIEAGAQVNTVTSISGKTGAVTLVKADVGLGNVDNTSDASKPVSTATQTALNDKANSSVTVSAGSGLTGGGNLTANRSIALNAASISSLGKADTALQAPGGTTGQILAKASADDNDVSWVTSEAATAVSYGPQTLTEAQKTQARDNIGAEISYDTKSAAEAASIPSSVNAIRLNGGAALGDGNGGLYIDTDNGSTDSFMSADSRTWYRARDVGEERLTDTLVKFIQGRPTARVEAKITSTGKRYDIIEIKGGNASDYIRQVINPDQGDPTVQRRIPVRDFANKYNVPIAVNSQAFINADGTGGWDNELLVPNGLLISDSAVITGWDAGTNVARNQGIAMQKNGKLMPIYRDGKSAQQLVDEGVRWAVSWGALCVLDGNIVPNINGGFMGNGISARTAYGQRSNGDFIILLFEGVSGSSGVTCDEVSPVALEHGCEIAFIVEGGGSTQAWWNSYYAHGSSDRDSFRTLPSCLIVDAITENEYDSGWVSLETSWTSSPLLSNFPYTSAVRQVGASVSLAMNASGFSAGGTVIVNHPSYYPDTSGLARGVSIGGGGNLFSYNMGGGVNIGTITFAKVNGLTSNDPTSIISTISWLQRSY